MALNGGGVQGRVPPEVLPVHVAVLLRSQHRNRVEVVVRGGEKERRPAVRVLLAAQIKHAHTQHTSTRIQKSGTARGMHTTILTPTQREVRRKD